MPLTMQVANEAKDLDHDYRTNPNSWGSHRTTPIELGTIPHS